MRHVIRWIDGALFSEMLYYKCNLHTQREFQIIKGHTKKAILSLSLLGCLLGNVYAAEVNNPITPAPYRANETKEQRDKRMAWFREARFGMFIHWGVYSAPGGIYQGKDLGAGEWLMNHHKIPVADYKAIGNDFTAAKYDPEAWVALAKRAGMRYMVITAKHHDGFALYDSAASDWNAVKASAAKRDLIAPLEKAARAQGLRFGLYYSQAQDWVHAGGENFHGKWDEAQAGDYDEYLSKNAAPQIEEIMTKFKPDILWWDTPVKMTPARSALFTQHLVKYPNLVMNDRLGGGVRGDCRTPEGHIPPRGYPGEDFEVCMTMNNTWGYRSLNNNWLKTRTLLQMLTDISSKGGNFLLNVGPTGDGIIPQGSIDSLEGVGKWLNLNGEAIYGTQATPFAKRLPWGRVTRKPDATGSGETLYLHVWEWPKNGQLTLPHSGQEGTKAHQLVSKAAVPTKVSGDKLVLSVPPTAPDAYVSVIVVHLPMAVADNDTPMVSPDANGVVTLNILEAERLGTYDSGTIQMSGEGDAAFIGPWTDTRWNLKYYFKAPKAQEWLIQAEIAAADPVGLILGSEWNREKIKVSSPSTGGESTWQTIDLGRMKLWKGDPFFTIQAEGQGWKPIRIRNVTLRPAP